MSYHEATKAFGLLVRIQRLMGEEQLGGLAKEDAAKLRELKADFERMYPDGQATQ